MKFEEYRNLLIDELHKYFNIMQIKKNNDYVTIKFIDKFVWLFDNKCIVEYYETSSKDYKLHAFILKGLIEHDYLEQIKKKYK